MLTNFPRKTLLLFITMRTYSSDNPLPQNTNTYTIKENTKRINDGNVEADAYKVVDIQWKENFICFAEYRSQ